MKWRSQALKILVLIELILLLSMTVRAIDDFFIPVQTINSPQVYLQANESISFQNDINTWALVSVTTGTLNASANTITITQTGGSWSFTPDATVSMQVAYSNETISAIKIDDSVVANGTIASFDASPHKIEWLTSDALSYAFWLPFEFMMGMFGLVGMIGFPMIMISKAKKKEFSDMGFMFAGACISAALFFAWLWMA